MQQTQLYSPGTPQVIIEREDLKPKPLLQVEETMPEWKERLDAEDRGGNEELELVVTKRLWLDTVGSNLISGGVRGVSALHKQMWRKFGYNN